MSEIKSYIEQEIEKRKKVYLTKNIIAQQDYLRESEDWQSYHGRELLELLQNADDEITDELPASVKISFHDNRLTISNNGEPFSKEGIISLMYSNVSPKREREKEVIGNKGTGFRSILGWAKEITIHSGDLHIRFTKEYSQACLDELFKENGEIYEGITAAFLAFPEWIEDDKENKYTTSISISIKDDLVIAEDINKQINSISSELLLFLNRIQELVLETDEKTGRFVKYGNVSIDYYENEELINHKEWFMNRSDGNIFDKKKYSVVVAYDKSGALPDNQVLYSYFPTKILFPFPVLVHANFDVNSNRNHLVSNEANRAVLLTVTDMLIDTAKKIFTDGVSYSILDFLLPLSDIPIDLKEYDFEETLKEKIRNEEIVPNVNDIYINMEKNPVYYSGGLSKYVSGPEFEYVLKYTDNERILKFIKESTYASGVSYSPCFLIYSYEDIVDKLNRWVISLPKTEDTLVKVANCIISLIDEDDYGNDLLKHNLNIFFDMEYKIVSNNHEIFLQEDNIKVTNPPKFAKINFLHPDMVKAFRHLLSDDDLSDYLEPLNIKEYRTEDIIDCMNEHIFSALEKKEKMAYEYVIQEIKWLWRNRNSLNIIDEVKIYLPTINGKIEYSNKLYFGREYGNDIGFKIISAFDDESFVVDLKNILSESSKNIIAFLKMFGVELFPRIQKESFWTYTNKNYWEFVLDEIEFPCKQEGFNYNNLNDFIKDVNGKIVSDNVEGLDKILDTCKTEDILEWIRNDTRIYYYVTNHYDPKSTSIKAKWGNYRVEREIKGIKMPLSYIYFMFCTRKWISVKDIKYGISDCLLSIDGGVDLSPELVSPDINEYIKDLPGKKAKLRADFTGLFDKIGVKRDFADLPIDKIYSVLLTLPLKENSGRIASMFYSQMIEDYNEIQKRIRNSKSVYNKFIKEGKIFCKDGEYHNIKDSFYVAGKGVCSSIIAKMFVMELPRKRVNFSSVPTLFGVKRLILKGTSLISTVPHVYDDKFQRNFLKYKTLAFAYRLDAKKDLKEEARRFAGIQIHLCKDVVLKYKDSNLHLNPYDFFLNGTNDYYLSVPDTINPNHNTQIGIAVANILCTYLDVYENESDFRELFNAGSTSDRMMILRESVGEVNIQRAREAMNDEKNIREEFEQIIDKLSNKPIKDVKNFIDELDFEDLGSVANSSVIINLFRELEIDIDMYNKENPSVVLDLSDYYTKRIKDTLPKYMDKYYSTLYKTYMKETLEKKKSFQSMLLEFNEIEIKVNNSVYFDIDKEIIAQLRIDINSEPYDLTSVFKQNLKIFKDIVKTENRDKLQDFIQYPENASLIYFAEYDELTKRFKEIEDIEEKEYEGNMSELIGNIDPVVVETGDISPLIPQIVKSKSIHKTGFESPNKSKKLLDIGLRGEYCVYELLKKDINKKYVIWASENAQKAEVNPQGSAILGYDMEYVDDELGKCYVEVKASTSSLEEGIRFYMSENEYRFACENSGRYFIYYVSSVNNIQPKVTVLGDVFKNNEFNNINYYLSAKEYYISANCTDIADN